MSWLPLPWRRRKARRRACTPTLLQMEAVECGAACLGIVLAFFGRWVSLEELRLACGVSRDGSKASNMIKAARRYGLVAGGFKKEPAALRTMAPPMILHWNFNHFVVLEGFRNGRAYLNDPASGPRTASEEEIDQAFTGVVLTFAPGEGFTAGGRPPGLLGGLASRLAGSRAAATFVVLAGLALVLPTLVVPVFSRLFVDGVLVAGRSEWLVPLLVAMAATALVLGGLTWLQQSALLRLETRMALGGSSRFLWHVLRLPVEFFNQRFAGDISARVAINDQVAQILSRDLASNAVAALTVALVVGVLAAYDLVLTLVGLLVVSLNVLALRWISRRRVDGSRRLLQDQGKLHGTAIGGLQVIETLKATGRESELFSRWAGYHAKTVNGRQRLERYTHLLGAVPPLLAALNTGAILGIGGLRVMNGRLTLGELVAFQILMVSFTTPVHRLVELGGRLQLVEGDMRRLDDVMRYPADPTAAAEAAPPEDEPVKLAGRLELRGVTFGYSRLEAPLLDGFDLVLEPGSRVALVGATGSGKSTVARLVTGLYEPWSGEVLFDGRSRHETPPSVLRGSLAAVDQSISLFEGTVRENLSLWDATLPTPRIVAAARDAAIHDEIAARPGGYESRVEEGGANFSGGQQQRLEIARALAGDPTLLLLDEATSALDPATEHEIDQALRRRGASCLIVAHRLSTVRDADEILVLDHGRVVQRGPHERLVEEGEGPYARLIADQG